MGSCLSKEAPPPASALATTAAKRQAQKQSLAMPNGSARPQTSANVSSTDLAKSSENAVPLLDSANGTKTASDREVKVLLLGSGESGKSTIVKQMKILHKNGFSKEELYEYKPFVYKNVLDCIKSVINAILDIEPLLVQKSVSAQLDGDTHANDVPQVVVDADPDQESLQEFNGEKEEVTKKKHVLKYEDLTEILDYEYVMSTDEGFSPELAAKIKAIYNTPEVKSFIKFQQGNFYLIDSTHYFLSDIDRLTSSDYVPSQSDVLRTRKKTSGIFEFKFQMSSGLNIHMYDVGGQRSERKKWIHCFDNVTLIIFCVALSEYDQVLLEENSQNRLEESLTLFDSVVNSRWFARTSIVLFLNKIDVFADKLPYSPLENYFPDYNGGSNINKAAKYILWRFTQVNRSGLNIYPHVTQATDTSNIELVFAAVKETILENTLRDSGIL